MNLYEEDSTTIGLHVRCSEVVLYPCIPVTLFVERMESSTYNSSQVSVKYLSSQPKMTVGNSLALVKGFIYNNR